MDGAKFENPKLEPVVAKAMHQFPSQRYQTATEFADALKYPDSPNPQPTPEMSLPTTADEYPTPDPKSIVIEFNETSLSVNGLDFSLTTTIEDWMQVLGRYAEVESTHFQDRIINSYFWPHLGLCLRTINHHFEMITVLPKISDSASQYQSHIFKESGEYIPFAGIIAYNRFKVNLTQTGLETAFCLTLHPENKSARKSRRRTWPSRLDSFAEKHHVNYSMVTQKIWESNDGEVDPMDAYAEALFLDSEVIAFSLTLLSVNKWQRPDIFGKLNSDREFMGLRQDERLLTSIRCGKHRKYHRLLERSKITPEHFILTHGRPVVTKTNSIG